MSTEAGERIIRLVAGAKVHAGCPRVSAELPDTCERFKGLLPPVIAGPSFAIRKPAAAVFTLAGYVGADVLKKGRISLVLCSSTGYWYACPGES